MIRCKPHRAQNLPIQLLQIDRDPLLGIPAERDISYDLEAKRYQSSGWKSHEDGLGEGLYCRHCLSEGKDGLLDYDRLDLDDEGLPTQPLVFKDAASFRIEDVWPALEKQFAGAIVDYRDSDPKPAQMAPLPAPVAQPLRDALARRLQTNDPKLYSHQAKAIQLALDGNHVVIETATASGKSLTYTVPILQAVLEDPDATAIYISPINALSEDQLDSFTAYDQSGVEWQAKATTDPLATYLREIQVGGRRIRVARYDGEVDKAYRAPVKLSTPNILVTNPDMLHVGILPNAQGWTDFLSRLRYVVIDEMHVYRGIFGAHVANVVRRLRRICQSLGASPQFISCSATIRNAVELAETITGCSPALVGSQEDGSPRRMRRFALWDTGRTDDVINTEAKNLMLELLGTHRVKTITFMRSIPGVRALDQYMREDLAERFGSTDRLIESYYRALPTSEKRQITRDLQVGRLQGVVSTTALQMGIDIGDLSAALIVKYPGSMSAVGQQAGRVGRKGEGLVFLLLDKDPLNQFFARHPDQFFALGSEEVYVDPDNRYVLLDHICCAAKERPVNIDRDIRLFGEALPSLVAELVAESRLKQDITGDYVSVDPEINPALTMQLRGVGFEFPIIHGREEILREDSSRAARAYHLFARFTLHDDVYEVTDFFMDKEAQQGHAKVRKVPGADFVTASNSRYETENLSCTVSGDVLGHPLQFGTIRLSSEVLGYYKVPVSAKQLHQKPEFQSLGKSAPPVQSYETKALWLTLSPSIWRGMTEKDLAAGARSMQKALALAACVELKADLADVAGLEVFHGPDGLPVIYVYDTMPGGSGLAEKTFVRFQAVLETARVILRDCPYCSVHPESRGCARCVSEEWGVEESIDRRAALRLLDAILGGTEG